MKTRDISQAQLEAALRRHGFKPSVSWLGYWSKNGIGISTFNHTNRRQALAYILNRHAEIEKERVTK